MGKEIRYRGITYTEREIDDVRRVIADNPDKSRFFLSKELCLVWNWVQPNGTPKDMVCRGVMLLLDREGLIALPPKKRELAWLCREKSKLQVIEVDDTLYTGTLSNLRPLYQQMVRRTPKEHLSGSSD